MKPAPEEFARKSRALALLEFVPVRTFQIALRLIPRRTALAVGRLIGLAACALDRRHREVAHANLRASLPEAADERARRRIVRRCFAHFGAVGVECLLLPYRKLKDLDRLVVFEGIEHLKRAHMLGKGVFVASAHAGNWEIAALFQGWEGVPIAMVTRPLDNPYLDRMLARGRRRSGNEIIHKRNAVRGIMKALKDGWSVAILIDQDFPESERIFVDFFGRPAAAAPTLGLLALRTGAPVVPVASAYLPDGRIRVRYHPPVEPKDSGDRDADALDIMQRATAELEAEIRQTPDQWLWMHRRWKTRPRDRAVAGSAGKTT